MATSTGITIEEIGNYLKEEQGVTFDEKVKMYMKLSKLDLARMLAERDRTEPKMVPYPDPYPIPQPNTPYPYPSPWGPWFTTCSKDMTAETINHEEV